MAEPKDSRNSATETPIVIAEQMPTFQGGNPNDTFRSWLGKTMEYPQAAVDKGIEGTVIIQFVIEKDGSLSSFEIKRSPDKLLSDAAVKAFEASPKWEPARQEGQPVRLIYTFSVYFKL